MLRDDLLGIQQEKGGNWITIDDLPDQFKYVPDVFGASSEIHFRKIQAILYKYKLTSKLEEVNSVTGRKAVVKFKIREEKDKLGKWEKFVQLANPDEEGISRIVLRNEFERIGLTLGNGGDFSRAEGTLAKLFKLIVINNLTSGNNIDAIQLDGFNDEIPFNQAIASWIRDKLKVKNCVMLGYKGDSINTRIEIDHKDGRKNDIRLSDPSKQVLDDFQPLCKAANDIKRQICKECKVNNERWSAKKIEGNPYDFYEGDERYTEELGCVGCYQYDPVAYRISSAKRLAQLTLDYVMDTLYPELKEENK